MSVTKPLKRSKSISKNVRVKQIITTFSTSKNSTIKHSYTALISAIKIFKMILYYEDTLLNLIAKVMSKSQECHLSVYKEHIT